ncbi:MULTISPECIES: hypothetical protein [unclassified Moorena]|uniref:hypothetical protein n=1 Tax=unclassified Moorena TaxID=2683338 RepID=UPI0013B98C74|nr:MULTISPECIES: hypothetical protein [unclassified Moorena]NEP33843.1 hypothetical protein [Moorena sp. SIO3B2]NEQ10423.1 hypothetical protein [Moorena sp. SIO4E2]
MPSQIHQKYCGYYSTLLSAQDLSLMGLGKTFEKDSMGGMGVAITDTQFGRESKAKKRSHSQYLRMRSLLAEASLHRVAWPTANRISRDLRGCLRSLICYI